MSSKLKLIESILLYQYWIYKAQLTFKIKYRNSRLGILWTPLSVFVVVSVIGTVWGVLLAKESMLDYYLYLFTGYSIWVVLAGSVEQGCREVALKTAGGIPFLTVVLERLTLTLFPLLLILPVLIIVLLVFVDFDFFTIVKIISSLFLIIIWSMGLICLLIAITSFAPDLRHFINAMMRLAFLATPIIWDVARLGEFQEYILFNPFYLPLDVTRKALLGMVEMKQVYIFSIYTFLLLMAGLTLLRLRLGELVK